MSTFVTGPKTVSSWTVILALSAIVSYGEEIGFSKAGLRGLEQFRLAVVKVESLEMPKRHIDNGVIVTPEGHVVIHVTTAAKDRHVIAGDRLRFHLSDGRRVEGKALGWSDEWSVTLAQISKKGPWSHVELCPNDEVRVGIPCISLGRLKVAGAIEELHQNHTLMSFGKVRRVASGQWLTSTCPMSGSHNGVFDQQGRLLGLTAVIYGDDEKVQTHVAIIRELWEDLVAGKNVDQVRALSLADRRGGASPMDVAPAKEHQETKVDAVELAKRATVRIRPTSRREGSDDRGWSGVVVTAEGHVVTCGHHDRMPGELVSVHFSDGKKVRGKILGTNRVTDIGVVKITDSGDWPFAKLGLSQSVSAGSPCIFSGYPANHQGESPIVRKGTFVEPKGYVWSYLLYASGFEFQGGDSGGGLFDENGVLMATLQGSDVPGLTTYSRSEFFHLQWESLTSAHHVEVEGKSGE